MNDTIITGNNLVVIMPGYHELEGKWVLIRLERPGDDTDMKYIYAHYGTFDSPTLALQAAKENWE